jgi:hypothetical protein
MVQPLSRDLVGTRQGASTERLVRGRRMGGVSVGHERGKDRAYRTVR